MPDLDVKDWLAIVATLMTVAVAGTYTYRAATVPHKVPHVVTWALLAVLAATGCAVQFAAGAGTGSIVLLVAALLNAANCVIGWSKGGARDISSTSMACAGLVLVSVLFWRGTGNTTAAAVFLTIASVFAFAPTVIRTWHSPRQEVQGTYWANAVRYLLATLAVETYSWATMLFPGTWVAVNGVFAVYHLWCLRRCARGLTREPVAVPLTAGADASGADPARA